LAKPKGGTRVVGTRKRERGKPLEFHLVNWPKVGKGHYQAWFILVGGQVKLPKPELTTKASGFKEGLGLN